MNDLGGRGSPTVGHLQVPAVWFARTVAHQTLVLQLARQNTITVMIFMLVVILNRLTTIGVRMTIDHIVILIPITFSFADSSGVFSTNGIGDKYE